MLVKSSDPSFEIVYTEVTCHKRCGTIKTPPCSRVTGADFAAGDVSIYYLGVTFSNGMNSTQSGIFIDGRHHLFCESLDTSTNPMTELGWFHKPFLSYFFFVITWKKWIQNPSLFIVSENKLSLKMSLRNDPILKLHFIISIIMKAASNMQKSDSLWTMCRIRVQVKRTKGSDKRCNKNKVRIQRR